MRLRIREEMEYKGWDATQLAVHAGVGVATIYRLLREETIEDEGKGGPGLVLLKKVARALGTRVSDLIEEDGQSLRLVDG